MIYKSFLIEENIGLINKKIFLFYGENIGFQNEIKKKIKIDRKEKEIVNLFQEDILKNVDKFLTEFTNISLFNKKKVFFINSSNDKILDIIKEVEPKIDDQEIIIFSEILEKKSKLRNYFEKSKNGGIVACYNDTELTIKKLILNRLKNYTGLTNQNINLIIDNSSLDRMKLNNELIKIKTYFIDKKLEHSKLERLLNDKENLDFNLLKDAVLNGDKKQTNKLLGESQIDIEKNILYLNSLYQRLNKISEVNTLTRTTKIEDAISIIKPPIFWKDKPNFIIQAKKWDTKKIKSMLDKIYRLEIVFKTNSLINKKILMKKLLVDMCNVANA